VFSCKYVFSYVLFYPDPSPYLKDWLLLSTNSYRVNIAYGILWQAAGSGEVMRPPREHLKFKKSELERREGIASDILLCKEFKIQMNVSNNRCISFLKPHLLVFVFIPTRTLLELDNLLFLGYFSKCELPSWNYGLPADAVYTGTFTMFGISVLCCARCAGFELDLKTKKNRSQTFFSIIRTGQRWIKPW